MTRYTFRRSAPPVVPAGQAGIQEGRTRPFSQTTGTDHTQSGNAPEPRPTEPVTLVRFAVYCKPDVDSTGRDRHHSGSGLGTGCFIVVRERADLHNLADIETIESLGCLCEGPGVSSGLRERIKTAVADYAATWVEGQGGTWWQTQPSIPLPCAADFFDGSADWLRGLVERPVAGALSTADDGGPVVPVAGITARFVTVRVTPPLEGAALICEFAGIAAGAFTGMHGLLIASVKRFAHDEVNRLLGKVFEQVISSIERSLHGRTESEIREPESSSHIEHGASRQPSPSRDTGRDIRPATSGQSKDGPHHESTTDNEL